MELNNQALTDEQAIRMMRDFVQSQEKLQAERARAVEQLGGEAPRYTHYTSAETALDNFRSLMMG